LGDFSHLGSKGEAAMVDITGKASSARRAVVKGRVSVSALCVEKLTPAAAHEITRTARLAGIQAAKQTAQLVPLCHPIPLAKVDVAIEYVAPERQFLVAVTTATDAATGVEMEALCAATVAGVTLYGMIKAVDPGAEVGPFRLMEKSGGKLGTWTAHQDQ